MKTCWIFALLGFSIPALGLSGGMEKAVVHAMRKIPCIEVQNSAQQNQAPPEIAGDSSGGECMEYEVRTAKVRYLIRPRRTILLRLGADVSIKMVKNELLLRSSDAPKEIHCTVLAMSLRAGEEDEAKNRRRQAPVCLSEFGEEVPCSTEPEPFP